MVTVHTSAGSAVSRAAVEAAAEASSLGVLALTVITSAVCRRPAKVRREALRWRVGPAVVGR